MPAKQLVHTLPPVGLYIPALQVDVHVAEAPPENLPEPHAVQAELPEPEYVLTAQLEHAAPPGDDEYVPAAQPLHAVDPVLG